MGTVELKSEDTLRKMLFSMEIFEFSIRPSLGWWASARTPPAVMLLPMTWEKKASRTATLLAPSPTPEMWALASLPIPTPPPPICVKLPPVKKTLLAALI
ncbi:hypothetical protein SNOG_20130 [Parastagonospora nodorum SN15]|uniref:Uncharacterized protein n=1 Tax=Phaeosphaeria nodorum (strain SN15 / ATCC MYA-4574 / FGSC 10173) TaxID=321614 RepID=A9JXC6_PHANO|nr:hypothetical protein SNOG_20130 [Parastagonospora nodorum SN15]EDP89816.1 hypothetical protein SNOG_20130 [Parastagonospora nodorum SN15]